MKKKIYRYEHTETRKGPYCTIDATLKYREASKEMMYKHTDDKHPCSWADGIDKNGWIHACPSYGLIAEWFQGYHDMLYSHGYKIHIYEIDVNFIKTGRSGKQILFDKNEAKLIGILKRNQLP